MLFARATTETWSTNKASRKKLMCWMHTIGVLFVNILGAMARKIAILGLNVETKGDVDKAHILARGKYVATAFLLRLDMRRYEELILSLKNKNIKQQMNYPVYI